MNGVNDRSYLLKGFGLALLATLLWSGNFIVARALNETISPFSLAFYRWIMATIILFPIAYKKVSAEWREMVGHIKYLSVVALTGVSLFNTLIYIAGKTASAMNMALIGTTSAPVFVLLITGIIMRQKIFWNQIAGAIICISGILILLSKGSWQRLQNFQFTSGDLWIFAAAFVFAIYTILVRKKPQTLSATSFLFAAFFLGTLFLLPAFIFDVSKGNTVDWNSNIVLVFLYLGIGASVIAFLAWNNAIKIIGAPRTSLFGNLVPAFSTVQAALILNEELSIVTFISILVIIAGIFVGNINLFFQQKN
ncbi:MAG TPA: DMT family transporter [Flavisolibacter sp.]|nr:DMT family transporter [Flavisolibacter sp.]